MKERKAKTHLGDGVYAEINDIGTILLTTEGHDNYNTIYLEPEVYWRLQQYMQPQQPSEDRE